MTSKDHFQAGTRNDRGVRGGPHAADDLEITSQPQPGRDVKVVKHLNLMFRAGNSSTLCEQIDIVLQHTAEIRERVADAEIITWPAFEKIVPPAPDVEESRDRARRGQL